LNFYTFYIIIIYYTNNEHNYVYALILFKFLLYMNKNYEISVWGYNRINKLYNYVFVALKETKIF